MRTPSWNLLIKSGPNKSSSTKHCLSRAKEVFWDSPTFRIIIVILELFIALSAFGAAYSAANAARSQNHINLELTQPRLALYEDTPLGQSLLIRQTTDGSTYQMYQHIKNVGGRMAYNISFTTLLIALEKNCVFDLDTSNIPDALETTENAVLITNLTPTKTFKEIMGLPLEDLSLDQVPLFIKATTQWEDKNAIGHQGHIRERYLRIRMLTNGNVILMSGSKNDINHLKKIENEKNNCSSESTISAAS